MARTSIPRKRLTPNIKTRRARSHGGATRMAGLPAVRMASDTLDVESLLNSKGFTKRGVSVSSFVFAGIAKPVAGSTSKVTLEKASKDPVFIAVDGGPRIDEVTLSRFYNDDRYDWSELLEATIERLQSFEPVKAKPDGCLIIDDTVIEKFGKAMQTPYVNRWTLESSDSANASESGNIW